MANYTTGTIILAILSAGNMACMLGYSSTRAKNEATQA